MTNEEAIKVITTLLYNQTGVMGNDQREGVFMAISALEKQIPKPTTYFKTEQNEGYKCQCGCATTTIQKEGKDITHETPQYCKWCKQRVFIEEATFTKSDKTRVGTLVFWDKKEAERYLANRRAEIVFNTAQSR